MKQPLLCRLGFHEYEDKYNMTMKPPECWHCGHRQFGNGIIFIWAAVVSMALCISLGVLIYLVLR